MNVQVDHLQVFPYSDEHDPLRICGGFRLDPISHLPGILRTKFLPRFITEANGMLQVDLTDQEIQQKRSQSTIGTYGPDVRDHVPVFWHPRNPATYRMITSANTRGINVVFTEFKANLIDVPNIRLTSRHFLSRGFGWLSDYDPTNIRLEHISALRKYFPGGKLHRWTQTDGKPEASSYIVHERGLLLQAELLVPGGIGLDLISALWVSSQRSADEVLAMLSDAASKGALTPSRIVICPDLFFAT